MPLQNITSVQHKLKTLGQFFNKIIQLSEIFPDLKTSNFRNRADWMSGHIKGNFSASQTHNEALHSGPLFIRTTTSTDFLLVKVDMNDALTSP